MRQRGVEDDGQTVPTPVGEPAANWRPGSLVYESGSA